MNIFKALFGSSGQNLNAADAKARIESEEPLFILDVRQPDEFRTGHIAGAKLIPLNELNRRLNELPKDTEILCVCRSGSRSGSAAGQLTSAGYKALNLRGGMIGWQYAGFPVKKGK
ncbi:MAG: rhodanese-like domain-containing protein [Anaerolineae bacterium]